MGPDRGRERGWRVLNFAVPRTDGSIIAFVAADKAPPAEGTDMFVHVVDVASGEVTTVSHSPVDIAVNRVQLSWQPDHTALLYSLQAGTPGGLERASIAVAERVEGTWQERPLVAPALGASSDFMSWLDAERFVYEGSDHRLRVAGLDGRPELQLGDPALDLTGPGCVAPDGSVVAVPVAEAPADDGTPPQGLVLLPTTGGPAIRALPGLVDFPGPCSWQETPR